MASPSLFRRLLWLLPVLGLGVASLLLHGRPPVASAHALLVRADPPINAQLRDPPTQLALYFSEPLEHKFSDARVVDQNNQRVDDTVTFDDNDDALLHVTLKPLQPGFITVYWETVSAADGHRVSGSYPLTILNPDGSVPAGKAVNGTVSVAGTRPNPERVVAKFALLVAGCLLVGAFAFLAWVLPALPGTNGERARAGMRPRLLVLVGIALVVLVVAGLGELVFEASNVGSSVSNLLSTRWGERWLMRNGLLGVPLLALLVSFVVPKATRAAAWLGLLAAAGYLAIAASVTHGAAGAGAFWATGADFVHLLAASVWIGMLALLAWLLLWVRRGLPRGDRYGVLATALQRFSSVAVISLALLLFTGVVNGVIELGSVGDFIRTGYGQALLVKLVLLLPLLVLGAANAYVLRPRFVEAAEAGGRGRADLPELESGLFHTLRFELGVALVVLAVVAVLVQLSPTRGRTSTPTQSVGKFVATKQSGGVSATIVVDPNTAGINSFELYLTGAVDQVDDARLDFEQGKDVNSEARLVLDPSNPPTFYVGKGPYLAQPGNWTITVDLRRKDVDSAIPFAVQVPPAAGAPLVQAQRGGSFASPITFTPVSAAILALAAVFALVVIVGSQRRGGLTAGYLGRVGEAIAERVEPLRMRPIWSLTGLIVIGLGLGILFGAHSHRQLTPQQAAQGNPIKSSPESIQRGGVLFEANCTQCHGESGRGDGPLAKSLPIPPANLYDHIPYHPDQFFFSIMTSGLSGVMPAFANQISEEDRWNILNYLRDRFGMPPATQ